MQPTQLRQLQPFDILPMTGGNGFLEDGIRIGEITAEYERQRRLFYGIGDGIEHIFDHTIPIHSRMVYSIDFANGKYIGAEMTAPKPRLCDLAVDCGYIQHVFRCPWLDMNKHPETAVKLLPKMKQWWDEFIAKGELYGFQMLLGFDFPIPEDENHLVCSQSTTKSLIDVVEGDGCECSFPPYFYHPSRSGGETVGKVSPLDQENIFNLNGWGAAIQ